MKSTRQIVVTKRDGTLERFSLTKLSNCLAVVMGAGSYEPALARPLARAVAMHLQEWQEANPPTTSYVYRCVRSVLQQTGLSDVADLLAMHRRQRRAQRQRFRVSSGGKTQARPERWRKSALVETLENSYGLKHSVARFLAGQIEAQVFALDFRVVTTTFLAELLRNEVLAWGLADERILGLHGRQCRPPIGSRRPEEDS